MIQIRLKGDFISLVWYFYRFTKTTHCFSVVDCLAITWLKDILNLKESIVLMSYPKDIMKINLKLHYSIQTKQLYLSTVTQPLALSFQRSFILCHLSEWPIRLTIGTFVHLKLQFRAISECRKCQILQGNFKNHCWCTINDSKAVRVFLQPP